MHKARAFFSVCAGILLLALWVPMALAGGVNINWGTGCWNDGTPLNDLTSACNKNTGSATMTCSFAVSQAQPEFAALDLDLEGQTEAAVMPAWWQVWEGDCRQGAVSPNAYFLVAPHVGCTDMWQNLQAGGLANYAWGPDWGGNNRAHMEIWFGVPSEMPIPLSAGVEYYAAKVVISYQKTVGSGSCAGCQDPMIWGLYNMKAGTGDLTQYEMLTEALPGGNQCLRWQHSTLPCAQPVPAHNTTWGQVKSLYR